MITRKQVLCYSFANFQGINISILYLGWRMTRSIYEQCKEIKPYKKEHLEMQQLKRSSQDTIKEFKIKQMHIMANKNHLLTCVYQLSRLTRNFSAASRQTRKACLCMFSVRLVAVCSQLGL